MDEKYLLGDLERDSYDRLKAKYTQDRARLLSELEELRRDARSLAEAVLTVADKLRTLATAWETMNPEARNRLLCSTFPSGVQIDEQKSRTHADSPIIALFGPKATKKDRPDGASIEAVLSGGPDEK